MYSVMKSAGKWSLEPFFILERVVDLGKWHGARSRTSSRALRGHGASSTCLSGRRGSGARGQLVDRRAGADPPVARQSRRSSLVEAPVNVDARVVAGSSLLPDWDRRAPEPVAAEIDQSRAPSSHLPKSPSRTCPGIQLMSWLSSTMRSRMSVTFTYHESEGLIDQRLVSAPAVRVVMLIGTSRGFTIRAAVLSARAMMRLVGVKNHDAVTTAATCVGKAALIVIDGAPPRAPRRPRRHTAMVVFTKAGSGK